MSEINVMRLVVLFCVLYVFAIRTVTSTDRVCEPIRIEQCHELGYNVTGMPNLVGHELQQDAQLQLQTFTPLIQYGCSGRLRFFLCSVYAPMCTEKVPVPIGPCRALCEDVRDKCQPVLQEFGFPWPSGLNCSKFPPQNNDKHMCMEGPADTKGEDSTHRIRNRNRRPLLKNTVTFGDRFRTPFNKVYSQHYGVCKHFRSSDHYYYINRTGRCAALCSADINFTPENKEFADLWVAIWASVCFITTLFTLVTSVVDESRFQYPEGAIVFISFCYNVCSIAYIVRLAAGRYESSCHMDTQHDAAILIQEGLDNVNCTIIFALLYTFTLAANGWWVVLCIAWYLSVFLKWKPEAIFHYNTSFHLFAWIVPCTLTSVVLVLRFIDADELVGSCYVGNQSTENLLIFAIIPYSVYLLIGITVLCVGYFKKCCCSQNYSQVDINYTSPQPKKMDSLTLRMGIFAGLYILPAGCVLAANVHEFMFRETWLTVGSVNRPEVEIFTLKIFMSLIMGFTTSLWMWSSKAPLQTWKKLSRRLVERKQPLPSYLNVQPQVLPMQERTKRSLSKTNSETVV